MTVMYASRDMRNATTAYAGKRVLVIGGTRYFGRRLVKLLLDGSARVTLLTRGIKADPFADRVTRIRADRTDRRRLVEALRGRGEWDVVFDQVCYGPEEAEASAAALGNRVGRYVFTSTVSVYGDDLDGRLGEDRFDPWKYELRGGSAKALGYGEGKRQAEAYFFQRTELEPVAVRLPAVLGPDDPSGRLEFHVSRVLRGKALVIPDLDARLSLISSTEAADFLAWVALSAHVGPINAASTGDLAIGRLLRLIEAATGRRASVRIEGNRRHASPFAGPHSWTLDQRLAAAMGFQFSDVETWLVPLIDETCDRLPRRPRWLPGVIAQRLGWS
jgi:nucleoside-diphosphate-sugar epimerase